MSPLAFDPYSALARAVWRLRWDGLRARPGEAAFHLVAVAGFGLVGAWALGQSWPGLLASVAAAWRLYAAQILVALAVAAAASGFRHVRTLRRVWSHDWLSAQPVSDSVRRRRLALAWLAQSSIWALPVGGLLAWAGAGGLEAIGAAALLAAAHGAGASLALRRRPQRAPTWSRATPFAAGHADTLAAWQWAEAGSALAPVRMAPWLLVLLLVPRGPWTLMLPALWLIAILTLVSAWQRSLAVLPLADAWLQTQPLRATHWLRRTLLVPALLGLLLGAAIAAPCAALLGPAVAAACAAATAAVLALQWAVTMRWRRQPARIPLNMTIHLVVLAGIAQALPVAAAPVWAIQIVLLVRRGLR